MRTIGLIGGMSWESTVIYYQVINELIKERLGGLHSAKILLYSVDFYEIEKLQSTGEWDKSADILTDAGKRLELAGTDFILICTNTMHKVIPQMKQHITIPIIHIADAAAQVLKKQGISVVGLLGTKFTMLEDFYKDRLIDAGIQVLIPDPADVELVNSVIYNELCLGVIREESRQNLLNIVGKLESKGARGVILGCTEIGLLIQQKDTKLPVFDTTLIHAEKAAELAIEKELETI